MTLELCSGEPYTVIAETLLPNFFDVDLLSPESSDVPKRARSTTGASKALNYFRVRRNVQRVVMIFIIKWLGHGGVATFVSLAHVFSCKFSHTIRVARKSLGHITIALLTSASTSMSFLVDFFRPNLATSLILSSELAPRADNKP